VIPKRRAAEKAPLSFCAQPIIATFRARRWANASPAKPSAIIAQVEGSGTAASLMLAFDWPS
jgi:hypothetical protein